MRKIFSGKRLNVHRRILITFPNLGVNRRDDTSIGEGMRTLQYEEDKLNNRNKSDYDSEVKKILIRE